VSYFISIPMILASRYFKEYLIGPTNPKLGFKIILTVSQWVCVLAKVYIYSVELGRMNGDAFTLDFLMAATIL